jgi:hypothetical protein
MVVVDSKVRKVMEITESFLNLDTLVLNYPELKKSTIDETFVNSGLGSKKPSKEGKTAMNFQSRSKLALNEICYTWASALYEQAQQIILMQKIIAKKEDSSTHQKFLHEIAKYKTVYRYDIKSSEWLTKGDFLSLFWEHLSEPLQDCFIGKIKHQPYAVAALYPHLHKLATELNDTLMVCYHDIMVFISYFIS